jgi:phage-related minor tail protein
MAGGRIKGITVEIGGNTQGLEKALKGVNKTSSALRAELYDVQRLLKFDPSNTELLAQKQQLLGDQVKNTEKKLQQLKAAEAEVQKQFDKGDMKVEQYRAFQREVQATEGYLRDLKKSLADVGTADTKQAVKGLQRLKQAAKDVASELDSVKNGFAGLGAGAAVGVGALVAGSEELNRSLARLNFNAFNEGFNPKNAEDAFKRVVAITGETDSAVETVSNLMQTGFSDEQLSQAIDHINGAAIKFSDTLKTEGIADGLQETFATGSAVGMFGELLERSGVNLDDFNEKLAEAKKNGTETDLVLQTMADLGLASSAEGYREMNAEVVKQAEAQLALQMALAELAIVFAPIVAAIADIVTKMVEWAAANPALTVTIVAIVTAIGLVIGICMALAPVLGLITGLAGALNISMLPITLTVLAIIAVFALLVAAGIYLYKNWDTVSAKAKELASKIKAEFEKFRAACAEKIEAAKQKIQETWNKVMEFFRNIDLKQIGKDIIQGLIDGIKSMGTKVANAARDISNKIGEKVKSILKLGSPSKVLYSMGADAGEGLELGIKDSISKINSISAEMGKAAIPNKINHEVNAAPTAAAAKSSGMIVNIHSPKALDARESIRAWNRTMKKMQLQW